MLPLHYLKLFLDGLTRIDFSIDATFSFLHYNVIKFLHLNA